MTLDVLLTAVSRSWCIFWVKTYNCIKVISVFHPKKKQSTCPKFWLTTWFESREAPEQAARAAVFAQGAEITLWLQLKTLRPKKVCVWTSGSCSHFNRLQHKPKDIWCPWLQQVKFYLTVNSVTPSSRHSATSWGFSALLRHLGLINKQQLLLALAVEGPWGMPSTTLPTVSTLHFPAPTANRPWVLGFGPEIMSTASH